MERIFQRTQLPPETLMGSDQADMHPVIRTLYDHIEVKENGRETIQTRKSIIFFQEVKCLAFHPREQILASGSMDFTLKLFDFQKSSVKRAFKTIHVRDAKKANSV